MGVGTLAQKTIGAQIKSSYFGVPLDTISLQRNGHVRIAVTF